MVVRVRVAVRCSAYAVSVYAVCVCYSACNVRGALRAYVNRSSVFSIQLYKLLGAAAQG